MSHARKRLHKTATTSSRTDAVRAACVSKHCMSPIHHSLLSASRQTNKRKHARTITTYEMRMRKSRVISHDFCHKSGMNCGRIAIRFDDVVEMKCLRSTTTSTTTMTTYDHSTNAITDDYKSAAHSTLLRTDVGAVRGRHQGTVLLRLSKYSIIISQYNVRSCACSMAISLIHNRHGSFVCLTL